MAGESVTQDGNSVDGAAAIEMDLQLVCSSSIVYLGFDPTVCQIRGVTKYPA